MVKSSKTDKKILKAARRLFIRNGYHGTTTQEIADHAHVNKALLHYHFRDKQNLYKQIYTEELKTLQELLNKLTDTNQKLKEKITTFLAESHRLQDSGKLSSELLTEGLNYHQKLIEDVLRNLQIPHSFRREIEQGISLGFIKGGKADEVIRHLIMLSLCMTHANTYLQFFSGTSQKKAPVSEEYRELLLNSLL